jgi:hypothetical protein
MYSVGTPKLQSVGGYVASFGHIILISSHQPLILLLIDASLEKKQQTPIL